MLGISLGAKVRVLVLIHTIRIVAVPVAIQIVNAAANFNQVVTSGAAPASAFDWVILILCGVGGYLLARATNFPGGAMVPSCS